MLICEFSGEVSGEFQFVHLDELFCTFTYPNGDKYIGKWTHGLPDGLVPRPFASGNVQKGVWALGEFKGSKKVSPTVTAEIS